MLNIATHNKTVDVRLYDEALRDSYIKMVLDIQQGEFGIPITYDEQPDLVNPKDFFVRQYNGNLWLAVAGGEAVGSLGLIDIGSGNGVIRKMFVNKNWRGREYNAAQMLLDALEEWAASKSINKIYLGTADYLIAANKFYRRNGYIEVSTDKLPAGFLLMDVDNVFYEKIL